MASSTTLSLSFKFSPSSISPRRLRPSYSTVHLSPFTKKTSLSLTSSQRISGFGPILLQRLRTVASPSQKPQSLTIVCAKGYKMKTHKVFSSHSVCAYILDLELRVFDCYPGFLTYTDCVGY